MSLKCVIDIASYAVFFFWGTVVICGPRMAAEIEHMH